MSVCYAKHQESILPRLTSKLGRSSSGPDRAPIAQALDQVLDRSPTLCRTNRFMLWPQSFNNKLVVVSTLDQVVSTPCSKHKTKSCKTGQVVSTLVQMWDSVSTLAQVVSTLDQFSRKPSGSTGIVVSTLDQVVSTPCSKHKTKSCKTGQVVSTLVQVVSTQCFKYKAKRSSSVDTSSGGVDTRDSFQKTF
ncbi:hypothetical protein Taro_026417, partial [Colocasia esculenta]|nr:hypothetical protein [Colocasia esculenta]